ncbi:MAG: hypothetical protein IKZ46_02505 [Victivallales bacterium]|nr:hypothetical protein [Victivallales bacterium]
MVTTAGVAAASRRRAVWRRRLACGEGSPIGVSPLGGIFPETLENT